MDISHWVFLDSQIDAFWRFVHERQLIWYRRFVNRIPPPWTTDQVLATTHFTNVYRELDPGTQYVMENILETNNPQPDKIFNVMMYRLIGREETHSSLGFQLLTRFDPNSLERKLKEIRDIRRESPFTGAYIVSPLTNMGSRDKIENVVKLFSKLHDEFEVFYESIMSCRSSKDVYYRIVDVDGFGRFLSFQVLVDLLYPLEVQGGRPLLPYSHDDWAIAGPGALRGISIIAKPDVRVSDLDVMFWLRRNQQEEFLRLGLDFPFMTDQLGNKIEISLANIQNCLCEFYKYNKIKKGTGRGRRRYIPHESAPYIQQSLDNKLLVIDR